MSYTEALADPKAFEVAAGVVIRPFHEPLPGEAQDFHVYCEKHDAYGFCGGAADAIREGRAHWATHKVTVPQSVEDFVKDLAEHGLRFDLNPTINLLESSRSYLDYIARMDASVRERAAAALA